MCPWVITVSRCGTGPYPISATVTNSSSSGTSAPSSAIRLSSQALTCRRSPGS